MTDADRFIQEQQEVDAQWEHFYEEAEPLPFAFCDVYQPHEPHTYSALNHNIYSCPGMDLDEYLEWDTYDPGTCEHGLSADLCSGPNHYSDEF